MSEPITHVKGMHPVDVSAWHRLMDEAFVRLWWHDDDTVTIELDATAAADVRERLVELVSAQRRRGGSLRWRVRRRGSRLRLQVHGRGATDTIATLAY